MNRYILTALLKFLNSGKALFKFKLIKLDLNFPLYYQGLQTP